MSRFRLIPHRRLQEWVAEEKAYFKAGTGERLVFEAYTREMFERTHSWMLDWQIFPTSQVGKVVCDQAGVV